MYPDISTYRREFRALRGPEELVTLGSVLGWQKIRHNWLESKGFTFGLLVCRLGDVDFLNARETSSTVWQGGVSDEFLTITRVNEGGGSVDLASGTMTISAGDVYVSTLEEAFTCQTLAYQNLSIVKVPRMSLRRLGLPEAVLRPKAVFTPPGSPAEVLFDLFDTDATVAALATRFGYASESSFSHAFTRTAGVSPRNYRALHRTRPRSGKREKVTSAN